MTQIKKLDKSRVEITGSIPADVWEKHRSAALKHLNNAVTIDGFRKGNIPENILIAKVGEMAVLEEMAELALPKAYMDILVEHKIDAVGRPEISVTKLAKGNDLEFKAVTAVVPEMTLPDYRKLAAEAVKKAPALADKIADKELEEAIEKVRKMHATNEGKDLPDLTDDFVKKLGNFTDIPDFKNKLSEMMLDDKKIQAADKLRLSIADAISEATKVEIPEIMTESELARTEAQFTADIERMGVKMDDYLKHAKKSLEDIRKEWMPHSEKKAKLQLILNEIAKAEKIQPTPAEIEEEVNHITSHYKDADRDRAAVYAETVLTNEKVFQFLEGQK